MNMALLSTPMMTKHSQTCNGFSFRIYTQSMMTSVIKTLLRKWMSMHHNVSPAPRNAPEAMISKASVNRYSPASRSIGMAYSRTCP